MYKMNSKQNVLLDIFFVLLSTLNNLLRHIFRINQGKVLFVWDYFKFFYLTLFNTNGRSKENI